MDINELFDLLRRRRSIRRFKPDPGRDDRKNTRGGTMGAFRSQCQPWEFIVVKDPAVKQTMAKLHLQLHREEHYWIEQTRVEELRHHEFKAPPENLPGFKEAPALIVVCGDRRTLQASTLASRFIGTEGGGGGDSTYLKNMANATLLLHLATASLGLGSEWLSVSTQWEQLLKPLLKVPPILQIHTIVPVGYPAYEPRPSYRRELKEIVHRETYEPSKLRSGREIIEFIQKLRGRTKSSYDQGLSPG